MSNSASTISATPATPVVQAAAHVHAPNVIAVASGKGGVGKTWLAITLSQAFARKGQKTLLFDGDIGLANVDIQLGLMPSRDLGGVIAGRFQLSQTITPSEYGFDIIAGKSGSASLASLSPDSLRKLRGEILGLAKSYDRVVIDLGAGVDSVVRELSAAAGVILVVTNDEPTALTDAYAFIKLVAMHDPASDVRIVVNLATGQRDGDRTYSKLLKASQNFLQRSPALAGIIRRDERVRDAIRNQVPLYTRHPMAEAAEDVDALAAGLMRV